MMIILAHFLTFFAIFVGRNYLLFTYYLLCLNIPTLSMKSPEHRYRLQRGRWKCEKWKYETWKCGTKNKGWKWKKWDM